MSRTSPESRFPPEFRQVYGTNTLGDVHSFSNIKVLIGFVLTFLMVLVNAADFQGADPDAFKISNQIYFRLMICGLCGIYGLMSIDSAVARYMVFPGVLVFAYGLVAFLSVPISMKWQFSLVAVVCLWCMIVFLPAAIDALGNDRFLIALATGSTVYVVVSWAFYFLVPEVGV